MADPQEKSKERPQRAELEARIAYLEDLLARAGIDAARSDLSQPEVPNEELQRVNAELRASRAALSESEARYRAIIESATDYAIIALDTNGRVTNWNEGARRILGWTEEEMLGRSGDVIFTPEDCARGVPEAEMRAALANRRGMDERWHRRKDDTRFWGSGELMPLKAEDGSLRGFIKILRDRTAQRQIDEALRASEQALRESEARFRNMADDLPVIIWTADPTAFCTYLNRLWYEFTGQTEAQALGLGWLEAIHPDDRAQAKEFFYGADLSREPVRFEYRLRRADGLYRWVIDTSAPRFDDKGDFIGFIGSVIDMTERREAEEALRAREEELRLITDALPVMISFIDAQERYGFINRFYESWFGHLRDEVQGKHVSEVIGAETYAFRRPYIARALAGETVTFEASMPHRDGTRRETDTRYIPRRDSAGKVDGFYALAIDITDRKRAEAQQRLLMHELSHRMKNMLTMVQAMATQTLRTATSMKDARDTLAARLVMLGKAQDILLQEARDRASVRDLVMAAVEVHGDDQPGRFRVSGPDLQLGPKPALSLSLALHELATNAAKYGALSTPDGHVEIAWSIEPQDNEPCFRLRWSEHGGPPVVPPSSKGFGSRLIERGLAGEFGGKVQLDFEPTGVVCTITAPLSGLIKG
jgi:PAS domain S-box-containing protein